MHRQELLRRIPAPIVTASVVLLLGFAIGFWGRGATTAGEARLAQIPHTRAKLSDGDCEFAAQVQLADRWSGLVFSLHQGAVRTAVVDLLRSKSRYMVSTNTAREALRDQMISAVNGVIGSGRATDVSFTEFDLL